MMNNKQWSQHLAEIKEAYRQTAGGTTTTVMYDVEEAMKDIERMLDKAKWGHWYFLEDIPEKVARLSALLVRLKEAAGEVVEFEKMRRGL